MANAAPSNAPVEPAKAELKLAIPENRVFIIKKPYLTSIKQETSGVLHLPVYLVSIALGLIYTAWTVLKQMLAVGAAIYLLSLGQTLLAAAACLAFMAFNSVFFFLWLVPKLRFAVVRFDRDGATIVTARQRVAIDALKARKAKILDYVMIRGRVTNPWTAAESVFDVVSFALLTAFFALGYGTMSTIGDWIRWSLFTLYTIADIILLGLPDAAFDLKQKVVVGGVVPSVFFQAISISLSLGLVASITTRFRNSVSDREIFQGNLANLVDYLKRTAPDHFDEVQAIDYAATPDVAADDGEPATGPELANRLETAKAKLATALDAHIAALERQLKR